MRACDHPEYESENQYLSHVMAAIDGHHEAVVVTGLSGGADGPATMLRRGLTAEQVGLGRASASPYFARVDEASEAFYIGYERIREYGLSGHLLVINWTTPMARRFYDPDANITRRRRYAIEKRRLDEISDLPTLQPQTPKAGRHSSVIAANADPALLNTLSGARARQMRDIVPTIQAEQYRLIGSTAPITIIQGAAGTGKTIVALHRLAYLLQRMKDDNHEQSMTVAIIGPHRLFLHYVSAVLPTLGHTGALHTTFEDWFVQWSGEPALRFRARDAELEEMLDTAQDRRDRAIAFRRAKLKASLRMGEVLQCRVDSLRQEMASRLCAAPIELRGRDAAGSALRVVIDQDSLSAIVKDLGVGPLNVQRRQARDELTRLVRAPLLTGSDAESRLQIESVRSLRASAEREFDRRWPHTSFLNRYIELLSHEAMLHRAADGILERNEQRQLSVRAPTVGQAALAAPPAGDNRAFPLEDVGPLSYLCLLLNGPALGKDGIQAFEHIVVDEAQDLAPLQFAVLRAHTRGMTILGDVAQGIHSYRGITTWDELQPVFGDQAILKTELRHSFRATRQLGEFANAVLQKMTVKGVSPAVPFPREGERPLLRGCRDEAEMAAMARRVARRYLEEGVGRVAVVCKTSAHAEQFASQLRAPGFTRLAVLTSRNSGYTTDVVVVPAYLVKGMEFEAAVVVGASAERYGATEYDSKLLYIAITRALHRLCVLWDGAPSPLLPGAG